MKYGGGIACQRWPCMALQEWNGSHGQILPWINMIGDISRCKFLPLECVINFTENDQNGPFKVSLITPPTCSPHTSHSCFSHQVPLFKLHDHTRLLQHRSQYVLQHPSGPILLVLMSEKSSPHSLSIISNSQGSCSD